MVAKKSRARRPAKETRHVLVAEGLGQLELAGMDFGVEYLALEAACAVTDVSRSSSRGSWGIDEHYTPRAPFQRTVQREWVTMRELVLPEVDGTRGPICPTGATGFPRPCFGSAPRGLSTSLLCRRRRRSTTNRYKEM
ncbi:MAG: hypothetical protein ACI9TF_001455 [Paracrocinitomix sp.]|jgi:hypothetical protein